MDMQPVDKVETKRTQKTLDAFYNLRKSVFDRLVYTLLRLYALELEYDDVRYGKYKKPEHKNRNLDEAQDLDQLLAVAKECYKNATDRRSSVTDKCKTLLTMSTFILAVSGLFAPKAFEFDGWLFRAPLLLSGLLLLSAVILLLAYFAVASDTTITLDRDLIPLGKENIRKALINDYLLCEAEEDKRTNYLVDLYKAARFYAMTGFAVMLCLVCANYLIHTPSGEAARIVQLLRGDRKLMNDLRGPQGEKGEQGIPGPPGPKGDRGAKGELDDKGDAPPQRP